MASRITDRRSGPPIPQDIQDGLACIRPTSGEPKVLAYLDFTRDEWNAIEAAAESAHAPGGFLVRAIIRGWLSGGHGNGS
jgi:hypothetical protein